MKGDGDRPGSGRQAREEDGRGVRRVSSAPAACPGGAPWGRLASARDGDRAPCGEPVDPPGSPPPPGAGHHRGPGRLPARPHGLPVVHGHRPRGADLRRLGVGGAGELQGGLHGRAPAHVAREHGRVRHGVRDRGDGARVLRRCCSTRSCAGTSSSRSPCCCRGRCPRWRRARSGSGSSTRYGFVNWGS